MKGTLIFTVHTKQGINDRNLYSLSLGSDRSFILSFVGGGDGFLGLWGRPGNKGFLIAWPCPQITIQIDGHR